MTEVQEFTRKKECSFSSALNTPKLPSISNQRSINPSSSSPRSSAIISPSSRSRSPSPSYAQKVCKSINNGQHKLKSSMTVDGNLCHSRMLKKQTSHNQNHKTLIQQVDFITSRNHSPNTKIKTQTKTKRPACTTITNKNYEFDLSKETRRYEQLVNKEKWSQVQKLFKELDQGESRQYIEVKRGQGIVVENDDSQIHMEMENIQELLMDQLRKKEYSRFQEKGYHQGLKSKTHQIQLRLKNIFKNYSTDEFFDEVMKKKTVQKGLNDIVQCLVR